MTLQAPKISEPIPGYVVQERIGVGGYGEVWSAEAPGGLAKAIKFVYGYFDDARAARELKALERIKQVRHPFLLSLERYEVVDGQLLIVTELADMSLKDRFEQCKSAGETGIPRAELLGYLRDAADALDYMSVNFALQHLDIKPENLLLVGGRVKVADFGLVKDLHDVSASLMGGLTPIYAAPEAFDDRPSLHSDQYSLAILYQEMLTGVLPFPGRTPAQLASQHLHARPRLTSLPPADQPVIARALAKDAHQRFASCRAMIDELYRAGRSDANEQDPAASHRPGLGTRDTVAIASPGIKTDVKTPAPGAALAGHTGELGRTLAWGGSESASGNELPGWGQSLEAADSPTIDLPPLEAMDETWQLRPTLYVGVGAIAARTLRRLRRKLRDRLGQTAAVPAVRMLLLDTDASCAAYAIQGDRATALDVSETLTLPLRDAHAYASNSRYLLNWLSRRWLYNIPRSMQTEGRRPLGRLALVDHAADVHARLRENLAAIAAPDAIEASTGATGLPFGGGARVYLIASTSGGTGGGTVLDLAYLLRAMLIERGGSASDLCAILAHSTDRNPDTSDLAIANTFACLSELQQYQSCGYPGEPAFALSPLEPTDSELPNVYFTHLGDGLHEDEFDRAAESLAAYLYLDSATRSGAALAKCRELTPRHGAATMRSFGIASLGGLQTSLSDSATDLLCNEVLNLWSGAESPPTSHQRFSFMEATPAQKHTAAYNSEVERLAALHAEQLGLDHENLYKHVSALIESRLGGNARAALTRLWTAASQRHTPGTIEHAKYALHAVAGLFGSTIDDRDPHSQDTLLRTTLLKDINEYAQRYGSELREWIMEWIEHPGSRLGAACAARNWYAAFLRTLEQQSTEAYRTAHANRRMLERHLHDLLQPAPGKSTLFGRRTTAAPTLEADEVLALVQSCLEELTLEGQCKLLRSLGAHVSSASDQIKDLQRDLSQLSRLHFRGANGEMLESPEWSAAGPALRRCLPELTRELDHKLQSYLQREFNGLRKASENGHAMQTAVVAALRVQARAAIMQFMKSAAFIESTLIGQTDADERTQRLQECAGASRPNLAGCGGAQRLIVTVPTLGGKALKDRVAALPMPATIVDGDDVDLVCCHEVQELPISSLAARVIDGRTDLIRVASRLHTRTDVNWPTLG